MAYDKEKAQEFFKFFNEEIYPVIQENGGVEWLEKVVEQRRKEVDGNKKKREEVRKKRGAYMYEVIKPELNKLGYQQTGEFEDTHYYFENEKVFVCFVAGNQQLIRAEFKYEFDKWGNASFQRFFQDEEQLRSVLKDLHSKFK